ncbi:hypothetical protein MHU86_12929 [Fragilaria crotonensis]|nr:hypothetical protein MHU86_12929 [Fragilaria crotonensis]
MSVRQHPVNGLRPAHVLIVRQCDDEAACVHDPSEDHLPLGWFGLGQELWDRKDIVSGKVSLTSGSQGLPTRWSASGIAAALFLRRGVEGPKNVVQVAVEAREVVEGG